MTSKIPATPLTRRDFLNRSSATAVGAVVSYNNATAGVQESPSGWTLTITGDACLRPQVFTLQQLESEFEPHPLETMRFGMQTKSPAVRLRDLLLHCGLRKNAVAIDCLSGNRVLCSIPLWHALADDSLISITTGDLFLADIDEPVLITTLSLRAWRADR